MKKNMIILALAVLTIGVSAFAYKGIAHQDPVEMAAKRTVKMTEKLGLSEEQVALVGPINLKYTKLMVDAHRSGDADPMELITNLKSEMKPILNAEQFTQFEGLIETHVNKMHKRHQKMAKRFHKKGNMKLLKIKRQTFDSKLTAAEKETIATFRSTHDLDAEDVNVMDVMKDIAPIKAIAVAHKDDLKEVLAEMKAHHKKGKMKRHGDKRSKRHHKDGDHAKSDDHSCDQDETACHEQRMKRHGKHRKMMAIHFLLMDFESTEQSEVATFNVTTYPNPATETMSIEYEVKQAGPVQIYIMDQNGNILQTVSNNTENQGTFTKQFQLNDHAKNSQFQIIAVKTAIGTVTKKVFVTKN